MAAQAEAVGALCALAALEDLAQPVLDAALPALAGLLQHGTPEARLAVAAGVRRLTGSGWLVAAEAVLPGLLTLMEAGFLLRADMHSSVVLIHVQPCCPILAWAQYQ